MIVEIVPDSGIGRGQPIVVAASQVVIRLSDGTPVAVAARYGSDGGYAVYHVKDPDFHKMLRALGVHTTVVVDNLSMPKPPPGARLVAGPRQK